MPTYASSYSLIAVVALVLALQGCRDAASQADTGAPPAPPVTVAPAEARNIVQSDIFTGRLAAVESVEVRARVTGYIEEVRFKQGAMVKKGDVLVVIDPRPFQANLARAEAEVAAAKTRLELARKELARSEELVKVNATSRQELDQRAAAVQDAIAAQRAAEAQANRLRLDLAYTRVTAPIDGRVGRIEITAGNLIQGDAPNSPLLTTIVATTPIYAEFEVPERVYLAYGLNAPGKSMPVAIGLASDEGFPREGQLVFVDNHVDPATGTVRMRAVLDNQDGALTPGLYARVRLSEAVQRNAVLVPDRAIGTDQDRKFVLVVGEDNKAMYREVKLGRLMSNERVVEEGLQPGELIVVNGLQRVRPGSPVMPQRAGDPLPAAHRGAGKPA
ncbi:MAG TPA: efflux RND transporter periplasmic adaptor subunit [Burkholderiales bacterium]|nr:efflux RND transporter periplasmic adaptor subunit [Burkholderiales bacterium]